MYKIHIYDLLEATLSWICKLTVRTLIQTNNGVSKRRDKKEDNHFKEPCEVALAVFLISLLPSIASYLITSPVVSSSLSLCVALVVLQSVGTSSVCGMWIKMAPGTTASTALSSRSAVGTATDATAAWTPSRWSRRESRNAACSSSSGGCRCSSRGFRFITYLFIYLTPSVTVCVLESRQSLQELFIPSKHGFPQSSNLDSRP